MGGIGPPLAHASPGISPAPAPYLEDRPDYSRRDVGDYAFRPFVAELLAVLGDHKSREKALQRYLAVTEHRH